MGLFKSDRVDDLIDRVASLERANRMYITGGEKDVCVVDAVRMILNYFGLKILPKRYKKEELVKGEER